MHGKTCGVGGQLSIHVRAHSLQRLHAQEHLLHGGRGWPHALVGEGGGGSQQRALGSIALAFSNIPIL